MLPLLLATTIAAEPPTPTVAEDDSWYRQVDLTAGTSLSVGSHARYPYGGALVNASLYWNRHLGMEVATTVTQQSIGVVPSLSVRPGDGDGVPTFSAGIGPGITYSSDPCGGPGNCEWRTRSGYSSGGPFPTVRGRAALAFPFEFDKLGVLVRPAVESAAWVDMVVGRVGWESGLSVSFGARKTETRMSEKRLARLARYRKLEALEQERRERELERQQALPDRDAIEGWHRLMKAYRVSLPGEHRQGLEQQIVDVMASGRFSGAEAARTYARYGTDLQPLVPVFSQRRYDCAHAGAMLVKIAEKTGQIDEARALLDGLDHPSCLLEDAHAGLDRLEVQ